MCGHLKFACEVSNQSTPNQITLNQTMRSQTKACITKLCEDCALVRYYSDYSALMFQGNHHSQLQRSRNPKDRTKHEES